MRHAVCALANAGFRPNQANSQLAKRYGRNPPAAITAQMREIATSRRVTPGTKPVDALAELLLHDIDIREPLGKQRVPPSSAFQLVATRVAGMSAPLALAYGRTPKKVAKGLRLVADDLDWAMGDGPAVHGSGSALLRALTGRPLGPDDLSGPGAATMYERSG